MFHANCKRGIHEMSLGAQISAGRMRFYAITGSDVGAANNSQ
jgi:hypothetical protein